MLNRPPSCIVIENFFGQAVAAKLLQYAIAHEADFRAAEVVRGYESRIDETQRVSKVNTNLEAAMPLIEPAIRAAMDDAIPKLRLVNVDSYFLETQCTWSGDGSFFTRHADTLRDRASYRVLTMVYYFHAEPKAFSGGQLRLYGLSGDASDPVQEIEPELDRAVIFPSWFHHEVLPIHCNSDAFADGRFALSCWAHRTVWT